MTYYLAIDQGSHASRACLFDKAGELVCEHSKKIKIRRISDSNIEQDANEILDSVNEVVTRLLHEAGTQQKIAACGIASQRSSVVAWKNDGTVISPVLSWQDTRGKQQLRNLEKHKTEIQLLSGLPLSAHYGASKLHYLLAKAKSQMTTLETLRLSPLISYLLFHILEEHPYIVDQANAQRTQLFDLSNRNWSPRLTDLFNIPVQVLPDCVPILKKPDAAHGMLAGTDIPVNAISGDQNAAIFGAGLLKPETALVNFGTGAFVLRLLTHYRTSEKQLTGIACSDHNTVQYVREATINGAASALTWLEKRYQVNDVLKQLPAWLDEIGVNETGLSETRQPPVFINTIGGLGSPWWINNIEAKFIAPHSPVNKVAATDMAMQAVAIIESIVFMVCINLEIMQSEQNLTSLRVSGGLSQLNGLCQRLASLSGLRVERMKLPETTARGVAWLAAGNPDGWSDVELDLFEPAIMPGLSKRYAMFRAALPC
ncbi:MAG: FGGY family carbohydrate kinase [Gammaproteobacteria bacterium]